MKIAYVQWNKQLTFYVAQVKGNGGKDWGYTTDSRQAIPLSDYWQRRFTADQTYCGRTPKFLEA